MSKFQFANGTPLHTTERTELRFLSHPEVTAEDIAAAACLVQPSSQPLQSFLVDLEYMRGQFALSSEVQTERITPDTPTTFGYRAGRIYPSRISMETGEPTSLLKLWVREAGGEYYLITAYPTVGYPGELEPLTPEMHPDHAWLKQSIEYWCQHALCFGSARVQGGQDGLFESTWRTELAKFQQDRIQTKRS